MLKIRKYLFLFALISFLPQAALTEDLYYVTRGSDLTYGLIDKNGKQVIKEQFNKLGCGSEKDHFDITRIKELAIQKKTIAPCFWNDYEIFADGKLTINKDNKTFLQDNSTIYEKVKDYNDDILILKAYDVKLKREQIVLFTKTGKLRTIGAYDLVFVDCNSEGCVFKAINNDQKSHAGYIDNNGELKFEKDFAFIDPFENGRAEVFISKIGSTIINKSGDYKLKPNEQGYSIFGDFILRFNDLKTLDILDKNHNIVKTLKYRYAHVINNEYFIAESLTKLPTAKSECYKHFLFNKKLELVKELDFNCTSMIFKGENLSDIFIAQKGFTSIGDCKSKCFMYMNTQGEQKTGFEFDKANLFVGELARVEACEGNNQDKCKTGFVNKKFEFVLNYK